MKLEDYSRRTELLAGWRVIVETYKLDGRYYSEVSEAESHARIARGQGDEHQAAERVALEKATIRLDRTRRST